jgi:tectonin-like protein
VPGQLKQVSVAGDGTVWGVNAVDDIFRWTGSAWQQVPGKLAQISVGSAQQVWGVNAAANIYRWTGNAWQQVPGGLRHVAVGADGTVWGVDPAGNIFRWTGSAWQQVPGQLTQIAVGSAQQVWGVNAAGNIFRWMGSAWQQVPGGLKQVAVAAPAAATASTTTSPVILSQPVTITNTQPITGDLQVKPSTGTSVVSPVRLWMPSMVPPGGGTLLCSQAIGMGVAPCGTDKADYVGTYTLDTTCDAGFYDMIYGGTCWKCPDDDGNGAWIRSATAVTTDDACWRVPKERLSRATMVRGPWSWAWDCGGGSFWDGYPAGGGCWKCPDDYPRRTANHVNSDSACATPVNAAIPACI